MFCWTRVVSCEGGRDLEGWSVLLTTQRPSTRPRSSLYTAYSSKHAQHLNYLCKSKNIWLDWNVCRLCGLMDRVLVDGPGPGLQQTNRSFPTLAVLQDTRAFQPQISRGVPSARGSNQIQGCTQCPGVLTDPEAYPVPGGLSRSRCVPSARGS